MPRFRPSMSACTASANGRSILLPTSLNLPGDMENGLANFTRVALLRPPHKRPADAACAGVLRSCCVRHI
eukprot:scaffold4013_cov140-Isochrysis_galbana.AAC.6